MLKKRQLSLLRAWLYWYTSSCTVSCAVQYTSVRKQLDPKGSRVFLLIFREVIQKPRKRTKMQPTVGRVEYSPKETRRCFSILWVWRTSWQTGLRVLGSLQWKFIYVTPSTYCRTDYLRNSINIFHVTLKNFQGRS